MRILIVQPWIQVGGAEWVSVYLAHGLEDMGHSARIAALYAETKSMPSIATEVRYILPPHPFRWLFSKSRLFFMIFGPPILFILVLRNSSEIDLINPHNFPSHWIARVIGVLRKIPVIWTCHEPPAAISWRTGKFVGWLDYLGWLAASNPIDRFLVRGIPVIHSISQKVYRDVKSRYGRESVVIRSGIDPHQFADASKDRAISEFDLYGCFVLLVVGKLHPQKNQTLCIHILRRILPSIPNALLVIVGDGPMRGELENIVEELDLKHAVRFLGRVDPDRLADLYAASDINLLPATGQSWGLTPFEALCANRLSIVSSDSGAAETLTKEMIGVAARPDAKEFASLILDIWQKPDQYLEMARRGNSYVRRHITIDHFVKEFSKLAKESIVQRRKDLMSESQFVKGGQI